MSDRCKHGIDSRFCSLCAQGSKGPPAKRNAGSSAPTYQLEEIVEFLNKEQMRATYGAVAELVGGIPRGIGARLTTRYERSPKASWVVNESTGLPTSYEASERHPALLSKPEIIRSGRELEERLARRKHRTS